MKLAGKLVIRSGSAGVLYISPLKVPINDQFKRLEQLLLDSNLPVTEEGKGRIRLHVERFINYTDRWNTEGNNEGADGNLVGNSGDRVHHGNIAALHMRCLNGD